MLCFLNTFKLKVLTSDISFCFFLNLTLFVGRGYFNPVPLVYCTVAPLSFYNKFISLVLVTKMDFLRFVLVSVERYINLISLISVHFSILYSHQISDSGG